MNCKPITYDQLKKVIYLSFKDDEKIFTFYDPNVTVNSIEDLTNDIFEKIKGYTEARIYAIYEKDKMIGYLACQDGILISFCLSVNYRFRNYLKQFWALIRDNLRGTFYCHLWSKNIRAVRWLMKMGMVMVDSNPLITKLKFK